MRSRFYPVCLATWLVFMCCATYALGYPLVLKRSEEVALPSNLLLSNETKRVLEKVWKRSPTFRLQCRRIAEATSLKVSLRFVAKKSNNFYALTTAKRSADGLVSISIEIFILDCYIEMIGHEFEHVIEQIEGWNLKELALDEGSGVIRNTDGSYETNRAVRAGRKVYAEYRVTR